MSVVNLNLIHEKEPRSLASVSFFINNKLPSTKFKILSRKKILTRKRSHRLHTIFNWKKEKKYFLNFKEERKFILELEDNYLFWIKNSQFKKKFQE
mgnify:CR=1 FL=1